MDPAVQQAIQALVIAAKGGNAPGISAFLTTGAYSQLNPNEKALVDRTIARTKYANQPGAFYQAWRAQEQAQGGQSAGPGQNGQATGGTTPQAGPPTGPGTIGYRGAVQGPSSAGVIGPSVFDNNQPGGAPGPVPTGPIAGPGAGPLPMSTPATLPPNVGAAGGGPVPSLNGAGVNQGPDRTAQLLANPSGNASNVPAASAPPTPPTPTAGGAGNPGGFSDQFGDVLGSNNDVLMRFAMQAAGFNPDIMTPASKIAAAKLGAMVQARRAAFGASDPATGIGGLPQDIASFAKEYTTPGASFYGNARNYAQGILGSQGFNSSLGGVGDQTDKFGMYQALVPLLYGGANPMIQQSVADQLKSTYGQWQMADAQNPGQNADILKYILSNPNLSPALRSIFGPQR